MPAISSKPFKAGDVIFETKPLFFCINNDLQSIHCNNCLKKYQSLKKCGKCLQMYYCDKSCQMNDWKYHKNECKIYRKNDMSLTPIYVRYLIRLWLCVKTDPEFGERRHQLIDGSDISINEIKVEVERVLTLMEDDMDEKNSFEMMCRYFSYYDMDFKTKELLRWCLFVRKPFNQPLRYYHKNELSSVADSTLESIGCGLFIQLSNISHSCVPNSALNNNGLSLELRAMKSITSGEQITVSYINLGINKLERKEALAVKLEDCHCDRCELDLDKDWNYDEFDKLLRHNMQHWFTIKDHSRSYMSAGYKIDNKFIKYLRLFFGENNPHSNELFLLCFICYAHHSKLSNPLTLTRLYHLLKKSMDITHGTDHPLYEMLSIVYYKSIK